MNWDPYIAQANEILRQLDAQIDELALQRKDIIALRDVFEENKNRRSS